MQKDTNGAIVVYCHPSARGQLVKIYVDADLSGLSAELQACLTSQYQNVVSKIDYGKELFIALFSQVDASGWVWTVVPPIKSTVEQKLRSVWLTVFAGDIHDVDFRDFPYE